VATGNQRDPGALTAGFEAWLAHRAQGQPPPRVEELAHASAGWANETVTVTLLHADGERTRVVLRLPPLEPTFPDYDLSMQAAVQRAAADAGVPAPVPATVEEDARWLGAPFMMMPFVAGHVPAQVPAFDPWVTAAAPDRQRALADAFVDVMAAVHAIDWASAALDTVLRGASHGLSAELGWWERYLEWASPQPLAVLTRALEWCRDHLPQQRLPVSLLWGDPRLGNLVYADDGQVVAVLDWELATLGPAEADLGWYLGQDRAMSELLGRTVPGFPSRSELLDRYQAAGGRPLYELPWFEVFGLFRSLAIDVRQARLAQGAGTPYPTPPDDSNPLAGVLQHCIEEADGG
jgi:aminoglycoside phosphotransferase (APT) family kinase protein